MLKQNVQDVSSDAFIKFASYNESIKCWGSGSNIVCCKIQALGISRDWNGRDFHRKGGWKIAALAISPFPPKMLNYNLLFVIHRGTWCNSNLSPFSPILRSMLCLAPCEFFFGHGNSTPGSFLFTLFDMPTYRLGSSSAHYSMYVCKRNVIYICLFIFGECALYDSFLSGHWTLLIFLMLGLLGLHLGFGTSWFMTLLFIKTDCYTGLNAISLRNVQAALCRGNSKLYVLLPELPAFCFMDRNDTALVWPMLIDTLRYWP